MSDFYIGQGDTVSALEDTLRDASGEAVNIAGADVKFTLHPLRGGTPLLDLAQAENLQNGDGSDGSKGRVRFAAWADKTDEPGDFLGKWHVTFADTSKQTYPNAGYLLITIGPDAPLSPGRYLTLPELKRTLKLESQTFADRDLEVGIGAIADALDEEFGGPWTLGAANEVRYFSPVHGKTTIALHPPLAVLGEVALDTAGGGTYTTTLAEDVDFVLERDNAGEPWKRLRFLRSGVAATWEYDPRLTRYPWGLDAVRVTGTFGWPEVPAGVKAAATILATRLVRRMRDSPFPIIGFGPDGATQWAGSAVKDPDVVFAMKAPRKTRRLIV